MQERQLLNSSSSPGVGFSEIQEQQSLSNSHNSSPEVDYSEVNQRQLIKRNLQQLEFSEVNQRQPLNNNGLRPGTEKVVLEAPPFSMLVVEALA